MIKTFDIGLTVIMIDHVSWVEFAPQCIVHMDDQNSFPVTSQVASAIVAQIRDSGIEAL